MKILKTILLLLISSCNSSNLFSQDSLFFSSNPFTQFTEIGVYLNHDSRITLEIYTNTGILKSKILKDSAFKIGTYLFKYGDSLTSGLYFVSLDIAPSKKLVAQLYKSSTSSSLNSLIFKNQLTIFPNPANTPFNISIPSELIKQTCNIKIIDMQGRLINSYLIASADANFQIPIEGIANGNYLILLASETANYQSMLSIQH